MKILLTGVPKSGKTTVLTGLISGIEPKHGMLAAQVLEGDIRIGFDLQDETGKSAPLARVDVPTKYPVGRYFVDVSSLDNFIEHMYAHTPEQLLYIDEIGQMQLYSERFRNLVNDYLCAQNDYIGTVSAIFEDPLITEVCGRDDVLLCTVTPDNRNDLEVALHEALNARRNFNALTADQQRNVISLARSYLQHGMLISLKKLFKNAVPYLQNGKVHKSTVGYEVDGSTGIHAVRLGSDKNLTCDCDFFNGRDSFKNNAGECSHIAAVKLTQPDLL